MKFDLSPEEATAVKGALVGSKVSYGSMDVYTFNRITKERGTVKNLYKDETKDQWMLETTFSVLPFESWLNAVEGGIVYKTSSKKIRDLAVTYVKCKKHNDFKELHNYIMNMDNGNFNIVDVPVYETEIDWLDKHVTNIVARIPKKYERSFKKNFPGDEYVIVDNMWTYSFYMQFDDVSDIPVTLLVFQNSNGNSIDLDHKIMHNTSYIWKLVSNYPQFKFGKRK